MTLQLAPDVIAALQEHTSAEEYNLIISAIHTTDVLSPMPFPFKYKEPALKD